MSLKEKVKITTDSSADLNKEVLKANNIDIAYLITMDNQLMKQYKDGYLSNEELFHLMENNHKITTSQPPIDEYQQLFEKALKDYEHVVHFNMSSQMSGSYQSAMTAKNMIDSDRLTLIDTQQVSVGVGLIVLNAIDHLNNTSDFDEFLRNVSKDVSNTEMKVVLNTLKYAALGGRVPKGVARGVENFNLRPILEMKDGNPVKKIPKRGTVEKISFREFNKVLRNNDAIELNRISFATSNHLDDLNPILSNIGSEYLDKIENIEKFQAGSVISTHVGKDAFALAYTRKK